MPSSSMQSSDIFPPTQSEFIFSPEELNRLNYMGYLNPRDFIKSQPDYLQQRSQYLQNDIRQMSNEIGGLKRTKNKTDWTYNQIRAYEDQRDLMRKYKDSLDNYLKKNYK